MKTDSIFYKLFLVFPSIFFELIEHSPEEASLYQFTSREIKQLSFRLDGLFLPTTNEAEKPFYAVEVQFQPDENLYYRLFGELFLFLRQYQPPHPWRVVVIYPTRSIEREQNLQFGELLALNRVRRIYLDELGETSSGSLGVGVVKLVIESEQKAPTLAKRLVEQAREELTDEKIQRDLIELIETIIIYKLPQKSRKEIEAMFSLSEIKQTKVYQEAKEEGKEEGFAEGEQKGKDLAKLAAISRLIQLGLDFPTIAEGLDLPLDVVQRVGESFQQQHVTAFIELINQERSLFSLSDLAQLAELIAPLPDEMADLSTAIALWLREAGHSVQLKALKEVLKTMGSGNFENMMGTNSDSVNSTELMINKQLLLAAINRG